jgi:uncharacterized protein involved in exopolysaccharide biosynthesis
LLIGVLWSPRGLRFAIWSIAGGLLAYGGSWMISSTYRSVALIRVDSVDTQTVTKDVALFFDLPLRDVQQSLRFERGISTSSVRMAFDFREPYMAQRILAYAVGRVAEDRPVEWVDPPTLPPAPVGPNRYLIALIGLLAGGGLYVGLLWRKPRNTGAAGIFAHS